MAAVSLYYVDQSNDRFVMETLREDSTRRLQDARAEASEAADSSAPRTSRTWRVVTLYTAVVLWYSVVASVVASAGTKYFEYLATMKRGEGGASALHAWRRAHGLSSGRARARVGRVTSRAGRARAQGGRAGSCEARGARWRASKHVVGA